MKTILSTMHLREVAHQKFNSSNPILSLGDGVEKDRAPVGRSHN